jgi:phage baseplate assembly protein W
MTNEIIGRGWAFPPRIGAYGVALTNDNNEIEQAIRIILTTPIGQRVMRPTFGSRLYTLVFEPNNSHTAAQARRYVEEALAMWEPRINVKDVKVSADIDPHDWKNSGHQLLIQIDYEVKNTNDPRSLVYPFYLIPEEG